MYAERKRPQHPVGPLPYVSQDVVFGTPDPAISPVGTLTYPDSGTSFPAVVLVAGTGPHTRDAGMSLHKTLAVLADHLTRQGFAVLRYDKRGVGLTGGALHPGPTTKDYAADALAAVRFLKIQPNIDPSRIGLVGHSEGGIIAAMVAAEAPQDVGFIVMLAGTGLPGIDNQTLQGGAFARAEGVPEPLILLNQKLERVLLGISISKLSHQDALNAMQLATQNLSDQDKETLEIPAQGLPAEAFESSLSPWFRHFLALDPREYLENVKCPVLALVGEKDLQVPPAENLEGIKRALERGENSRATVLQLPGINHNLQTARTGKLSEYLLIEETVDPSVLALMSEWMQDVTGETN
ncbi:MAG: alpha/beta hydrolase [Polynucleobacter sp.]|nr:alpha/beta hydrolase [Polynucleobacter sp.]